MQSERSETVLSLPTDDLPVWGSVLTGHLETPCKSESLPSAPFCFTRALARARARRSHTGSQSY